MADSAVLASIGTGCMALDSTAIHVIGPDAPGFDGVAPDDIAFDSVRLDGARTR
ncbi:hypothetical protein G4G28_17680 [Massilia sp. Dwa41.01b]|uniref:hypothetical protein n=1 Tax=unclassified Massilia TaxID=2609279 RepID=UPI0015FFD1F2|nr:MULTISPECIES: hypothetical protein [unclassified Massilia]QNA89863.1 hypothetical protein G4G28_17680 [Massilia sp. Dwa41.01b]QNB00753.1 hypothetical protein G4G31_21240 [Massilia sp. Se16.2.3]